MILSLNKTYTVTAETRDGETVWCELVAGWLILTREPVYLDHGPHIQDVYEAACADDHLFRVCVNEKRTITP